MDDTPREDSDGEDREEESEEDLSNTGRECSSEEASAWGSLPDICLIHVFRFLPDCDRMCASLVCRHWNNAMRSPSLWRSHYFFLSGKQSKYRKSKSCSAVAYVHSLGVYLERMDVCVDPPQMFTEAHQLNKSISRLFYVLARVKAPLKSLSLQGLELDSRSWTLRLRNTVIQCLILYLHNGASRLTSVRLTGVRTWMNQGLDLLAALQQSQGRYNSQYFISSLDLRGLFSGGVRVYLNPNFPRVLHFMEGLTNLSLSYSCLSDELLKALKHSQQGMSDVIALQTFSLHCILNEPHDQVVCGDSWAALASCYPGLKVMLAVDQIINTDDLTRILLPEIPLTEYNMTAFYLPGENWSAKPLLRHMLPQYRHILQCLKLDLSNCNESLDEPLLELVKVCERLEQLKVWAFLEICTVQRLLHVRLMERSSLNQIIVRKTVRIYTLNEDTREQEDELKETVSSFLHLPPELEFFAKIYPFIS